MKDIKQKPIKIKTIIVENWFLFLYYFYYYIRPVVIVNVNKILACNTLYMGFHSFKCPNCDYIRNVAHTCKSRFCNSCGKVATDIWITNALNKFINVKYRHITFTIPQQLRDIILLNRKVLINQLFRISADSILIYSKNRNFTPAIMSVVHTFGKKINFNPHIHMLVSIWFHIFFLYEQFTYSFILIFITFFMILNYVFVIFSKIQFLKR